MKRNWQIRSMFFGAALSCGCMIVTITDSPGVRFETAMNRVASVANDNVTSGPLTNTATLKPNSIFDSLFAFIAQWFGGSQ